MNAITFIDTNTFLHYRAIEEIDWLGLLDADHVMIMIPPVIIRELNKKKEIGDRKKIRKRAHSALAKLTAYKRETRPVRDSVEVRFRQFDPMIDFQQHRLNSQIEDDWLIATILEFRNESPDSRVVLTTNDLGLQIKAGAHGLQYVELPERYLLPEELDPDEKERQELERELVSYKKKTPELKLLFVSGEEHARFQLTKYSLLTDADISQKMADLRAAHPKASKPTSNSAADLMRGGVGPADIDRYNRRLDAFYSLHEKYLRDTDNYEDRKRRNISLSVVLVNSGYSPAEDIDVYMHFPDGLVVAEETEEAEDIEELLSVPIEPEAPEGPMSEFQESLRSLAQSSVGIALPNLDLGKNIESMARNVSRFTIRRTNSIEVRNHVRELKHNMQTPFEPLFVLFDSWQTTKSFTLEYQLFAANVPKPVSGNLHIVVDVI